MNSATSITEPIRIRNPKNSSRNVPLSPTWKSYSPANYVPQESERISLYQELDNMERETDIRQFCERLEDRFGRIPHEAMELIRVVRLRRLAKQLGIEKVGLKQGYMYLYFVSDEHVAYYQSAAFGRILGFLQKIPSFVNCGK